jgi:hypothetical protein
VVKQTLSAGDAKVDYRLSDRASVFARFSTAKRHHDEPAPGNIFMGPTTRTTRTTTAASATRRRWARASSSSCAPGTTATGRTSPERHVGAAGRDAGPAGRVFAVFYIPNDFHEDTAKMWNVGVQHELGGTRPYFSVELKVDKRFSHGLQALVAYT